MTLEVAIAPTRLVAMCLGPESGGAFDIGEVPRRSPGPDEIHIGERKFLSMALPAAWERWPLQTLSEWGARVTAVAKASDLPACFEAGACEAVERERNPFASLRGGFAATLNFATWDDEANWVFVPA
jgi:hypothetical protein